MWQAPLELMPAHAPLALMPGEVLPPSTADIAANSGVDMSVDAVKDENGAIPMPEVTTPREVTALRIDPDVLTVVGVMKQTRHGYKDLSSEEIIDKEIVGMEGHPELYKHYFHMQPREDDREVKARMMSKDWGRNTAPMQQWFDNTMSGVIKGYDKMDENQRWEAQAEYANNAHKQPYDAERHAENAKKHTPMTDSERKYINNMDRTHLINAQRERALAQQTREEGGYRGNGGRQRQPNGYQQPHPDQMNRDQGDEPEDTGKKRGADKSGGANGRPTGSSPKPASKPGQSQDRRQPRTRDDSKVDLSKHDQILES